MPKRQKQNSDHAHKHNTPTIDNEAMSSLRDASRTAGYAYANHLKALLTPAIFAEQQYYKLSGLRDRILNLSLMVAAVFGF